MPPRFEVGERVFCQCGDKGWLPGVVESVNAVAPRSFGLPPDARAPYLVRLDSFENTSDACLVPEDTNEFVRSPEYGSALQAQLAQELSLTVTAQELSREYVDRLLAEMAAAPVHEGPVGCTLGGARGSCCCPICTRGEAGRVERVEATLQALHNGRLGVAMIPRGSVVRVHGLVARPELNEARGEVFGFEPSRGRYGVLIKTSHDGTMAAKERLYTRRLNLERIEPPSISGDGLMSRQGRPLLLSPLSVEGFLRDEFSGGFGHLRTGVAPQVGQRFELCCKFNAHAVQACGYPTAAWSVFSRVVAVLPEPLGARPATEAEFSQAHSSEHESFHPGSLQMKAMLEPVVEGEVVRVRSVPTVPGLPSLAGSTICGRDVRVVGEPLEPTDEQMGSYVNAHPECLETDEHGRGIITRSILNGLTAVTVETLDTYREMGYAVGDAASKFVGGRWLEGVIEDGGELDTRRLLSLLIAYAERRGVEHIPPAALERAREKMRSTYGLLHGQQIECETTEPFWPSQAGVLDAWTRMPIAIGGSDARPTRFVLRANDWMGCMWELVPMSIRVSQPAATDAAAGVA